MRKRTKSPRGGRGGATRGARGGSRAKSTTTTSFPSSAKLPFLPPRQLNRRGPSTITVSLGGQENKPLLSNGLNGVKPNGTVTAMDSVVSALTDVGEAASSNDYYLHKKFKKLTSTSSECNEMVDSQCDSVCLKSSASNQSAIINSGQKNHDNDRDSSASDCTVGTSSMNSQANSLNSVYKPKFRHAIVETEHEDAEQEAVQLLFQSSSTATLQEPSRVGSIERLDRKSLDDRISKIIDENQSILSTWPEQFEKKLKSHTQQRQAQLQRSSQIVIMSGGGLTTDNTIRPTISRARFPSVDLPRSEIPNVSFLVRSNSEVYSKPVEGLSSASDISDLSLSNSSSSSSAMIPKKRRRLSPTPSRLCGGEVSELPVDKVPTSTNYFKDVDMTVRVSNCSGAKVTIRTNNGIGSGGSIKSNVVGFNQFLGVSNPPLQISSTVFNPSTSNDHNQEVPVPVAINLANKIQERLQRSNSFDQRGAPPSLNSETSKEEAMNLKCTTSESSKTSVIVNGPKYSNPAQDLSSSQDNQTTNAVKVSSTPIKRPTFLPLKPSNGSTTESSTVLPSPDTPRGNKSVNQTLMNGNAYTYLGFKSSTRASYTCLFKTQPMSIPQDTDPKLSMYSNWQPRPTDPKHKGIGISTNDSRINGRKTPQVLYTCAVGNLSDTLAVSSPNVQSPISSPSLGGFGIKGFPSPGNNEDYSLVQSLSPKASGSSACTTSSFQHTDSAFTFNTNPKLQESETLSSSSSKLICSVEEGNFNSDKDHSRLQRQHSRLSISEQECEGGMMDETIQSSSSSTSRFDNPRVRIMEGGFESNEDYTYVRGRGRGRYVCEACGIRCKKPSMLRKHLKTHTDLRPYTCKLCSFSFKTKGNLTKHQKSKSHHKKCLSLGIHPNSSRSLEMTGPALSDTATDDNDSDDDCDDNDMDGDSDSQGEEASSSMDNDNEHDSDNFEKEIAQSLLDLSKATRLPSESDDNESPKKIRHKFIVQKFIDERDNGSTSDSCTSLPPTNSETPMDLSVKFRHSKSELDEGKKHNAEKNGLLRSSGLVAEAQMWVGEDDVIENGCLNLRKVRNTTWMDRMENQDTPTYTEDIKPKISEGLELNNSVVCEPSRRRRDSSTSSTNSDNLAVFSSADRKVGLQSSPPPAQNSKQKLHQPWLSSPEKKPDPVPIESKPMIFPESSMNNEHGRNVDVVVLPTVEHPETSSSVKSFSSNLISLKPQAEFRQPSGAQALVKDEGKAECNVCGKSFARASQLTLHMNIHYLERPFRCEPCGVSFRTKGHLIKHRRSSSHDCKVNKVYLTEAWGVANEENPRPFKCPECKIAFRIHGHLAKHLRSKMHIMRMECLGKLPFGIYFELEKTGMNFNEIDTTDCDMSLVYLQGLAQKIYGDNWMERLTEPTEET